ncbi:MAG: hypothetical protein WKG07_02905 [Hymenobacter sp.]
MAAGAAQAQTKVKTKTKAGKPVPVIKTKGTRRHRDARRPHPARGNAFRHRRFSQAQLHRACMLSFTQQFTKPAHWC